MKGLIIKRFKKIFNEFTNSPTDIQLNRGLRDCAVFVVG